MDGSVRLFAEDCESMQVINQSLFIYILNTEDRFGQGFQIMNDIDAFGSFMNAFVVTLRDEYPKLTSVMFPVMSNNTSQTLDIYDVRSQYCL